MASKKIRRVILYNNEKCWITADNEQEYAEKILKMAEPARIQAVASQNKHNFREYAEKWFRVFSKPNVEITTALGYQRELKNHIFPYLGDLFVEDVLPADIQTVFNAITGAKETKMKARMVMNMILEQAVEDGLISRNPVHSRRIRIMGRPPKETRPYTIEQMRYLVKSISKVSGVRNRNYLALQTVHPLRLEEVLGLKCGDIDFESSSIHIQRAIIHPTRNEPHIKGTKTAASNRYIDLVPQIIPYLTLGKEDDFVLGGEKPLSYTQVRKMLCRIQKEIGFDEAITPRRFRATVLTDIYDRTKDIKIAQAAAGHTTAAMTLKHYVKGRDIIQRTAASIASAYGFEN